jgi:hypothetical protein
MRLERFLAVIGVVVCLIVSVRVWQVVSAQQTMWPLPGSYVIEMIAVSCIGLLGIVRDDQFGAIMAWMSAGVTFAFVVLGAWSIGFLYLPAALLLVAAAVTADRRHRYRLSPHLVLIVIAAVAQVAVMLIAIRLLYPSAVF